MKFIKILLIVTVVIIAGSTAGLWGYLTFAGDEPHFAGTCEVFCKHKISAGQVVFSRNIISQLDDCRMHVT